MAPHAVEDIGIANGSGSATPANDLFEVASPNVQYTESQIRSKYTYRTTAITRNESGKMIATPKETLYDFKVDRKVGKVGVMLVGWGGNNGSTVTAGII